jgi:hypothetical protein
MVHKRAQEIRLRRTPEARYQTVETRKEPEQQIPPFHSIIDGVISIVISYYEYTSNEKLSCKR